MMPNKPHWSFWLVSGLSLLWNSFGGYDYVMTQTHNSAYLSQFSEQQRAYFEHFPAILTVFWALGVWGSIAGSILLLMRSRHAVTAFAVSLTGLVINTVWEMLYSPIKPAGVLMAIIWIVIIALLWYARRCRAQGILR